jgi:hypothetical protein
VSGNGEQRVVDRVIFGKTVARRGMDALREREPSEAFEVHGVCNGQA